MPESGPGGDPALDAPLLAQALVALNRQGELLAALGNLFESAGHQLYLVGGSVDYTEGLEGSRFTVTNPNATTTCGCGSSFSI